MNRPGNEVFVSESASGLPKDSPLLREFRVLPINSIVFPKRGGAIATNKKRILQRPAILDPNTMGVFSKDEQQLTPEFLFKWFGNLDLASMQEGSSVPQINKVSVEYRTNVATGTWFSFSGTVNSNGGIYSVIATNDASTKFFRLRKP